MYLVKKWDAPRQHWSIENQLHWVLDVTFGEDTCRVRTGNAPENIALLKRWSINLLNQETSFKRSTRQKAMQRGLARQSVAEVPSVEGTVEGGGLPHERLHQDSEASQHGFNLFAESS